MHTLNIYAALVWLCACTIENANVFEENLGLGIRAYLLVSTGSYMNRWTKQPLI